MHATQKFSPPIKVFARLFQKAARAVGGDGRAPQSAKSHAGVFFLIAFSFAPASAKEKADRHISFVLAVDGILVFIFTFKETFLLSYFSVTKRRVQGGEATSERRRRDGVYQKSARRTRAVLLPNLVRRARVSRRK